MKRNNAVFLGLFFIFAAAIVKGQTPAVDGNWRIFLSDTKDVSISLPYSVEVISDDDEVYLSDIRTGERTSDYIKESKHLTGSFGGGAFRFSSYKISGSKEASNRALDELSPKKSFVAFNRREFVGRAFSLGETGYILEQVAFATKGRAYHLIVGSRRNDNSAVRKVLRSLKLNGEPVYDATSPTTKPSEKADTSEVESEVLISALVDSPFNHEVGPELETQKESKTPVEVKANESVTPLRILVKPKAGYTNSARGKNESGVVYLRISFGSDGKVTKIVLLGKGLKHGLNENAIRAARLLTFLPAEKDGKPMAVEKTFAYSFKIY